MARDWKTWHDDYDEPGSSLAQRLDAVQTNIRKALDDSPPGPLRVISVCAGQGRDVLGVLADHPRRADVQARLVELDPRNTAVALQSVQDAGLQGVDVVTGDASLTDHYADLVPADLVVLCGIFGNIVDADIERTIDFATQVTKTGGTVFWTRGRHAPDLFPQVAQWFEERGFERVWLSGPEVSYGVGVHRFTAEPQPFQAGAKLFDFIGSDVLRQASGT